MKIIIYSFLLISTISFAKPQNLKRLSIDKGLIRDLIVYLDKSNMPHKEVKFWLRELNKDLKPIIFPECKSENKKDLEKKQKSSEPTALKN